MSPPAELSCLPHPSIPGVWHATFSEPTRASHVRALLFRPSILRGPVCVCGSVGVVRVGRDLCCSNIETAALGLPGENDSRKEWLRVSPTPEVSTNFGGCFSCEESHSTTKRTRSTSWAAEESGASGGSCTESPGGL